MVANPRVNQVPVMIGGNGKAELHEFYATYFLPQIPPDTEMVPVSRTIGQGWHRHAAGRRLSHRGAGRPSTGARMGAHLGARAGAGHGAARRGQPRVPR